MITIAVLIFFDSFTIIRCSLKLGIDRVSTSQHPSALQCYRKHNREKREPDLPYFLGLELIGSKMLNHLGLNIGHNQDEEAAKKGAVHSAKKRE